jgi:peptidylprolyl isomerase
VIKQPKQTFVFRETPAIEEVLRTMTVGEVVRVWLPESQIEVMPPMAKGTLCYQIELLLVKKMNPPPPVPRDVSAPPADAQKTASGIQYRELKAGHGTARPGPKARVKVEYSGWTSAGRLFDSSVVRGEPTTMQVERAIAGWTEALQLMVVGQKVRFWIPEDLTFKGESGNPKGTLVFDLELVEILAP